MKNLAITLLFSTFSLVVTAQTFDDNFLKNFEKVYQKDPVQFLKNEVGSDFTIIYGDGRLGDKESVLKIYEAFNQVSRTVTELKTRQLGNTGIATGILNHTYTSKQDGSPRDYTNRFTYSFTLQNGKWNLVAVHLTDMLPMPFTEQTLLDMNKRIVQDFTKFASEEISPEYSFTTAAGAILTHQAMKDAKIKAVEWNTHDLKIKQIGNVAIVRGINDHIMQSTTSNEIWKYSVHFIYTFEYKKDKWLWLTAHHIYNTPSKAEDETAIKTATEAETKAYHDGNAEGQRKQWLFTPQTRAVATTIGGQTLYGKSGEEVRQFFADIKPDNNTFSNANYNIKISSGGKMAWATYDQTTRDKDGKTLFLAHEIRCLENVNGAWKVVVLSAHHYKP